MNYKSGDLVQITGNSNSHGFAVGETVRLKREEHFLGLKVWTVEHLDSHNNWLVLESDMAPAKPATMPQKIIITADGKTTLARLFDGKTMVKRAESKCAPSDVFDFGVGAELAVKRLMGEEPVAVNPVTEPVESEPVKLYCVRSIFRQFKFVKGKIYNSTHDFRITDENGAVTPCRYSSIKEHDIRNPDYANALVPLVRRPAKVGEWVLVDRESEPKQVRRKCGAWDGCIVLADGRHSKGRSGFTYLVLSGYTGDPE